MNKNKLTLAVSFLTAGSLLMTGCFSSSSSNGNDGPEPEQRVHDSRTFPVDAASLAGFMNDEPVADQPTIMGDPAVTPSEDVMAADRFSGIYPGIQGDAGYLIEIPENWDGRLIMWTRGFSTSATLSANPPTMAFRNAVLAQGYAWAASTYSANQYDVRAAIEDTNRLALDLEDLLFDNHGYVIQNGDQGITQRLIAGNSLGGHAAAAAVERETLERARYKVAYEGALPLCQAEQNEFSWLGDYARVAQELAGAGDSPPSDFQELRDFIEAELFIFDGDGNNTWAVQPGAGEQLKGIARNLTGGDRPVFEQGFSYASGALQQVVLDTGGSDGTLTGILARNFYDNTGRVYRWTDGEEPTQEELDFNASIERIAADPDANPLRDDGVRWLPLVQGDFDVPVLTLHTTGDFFVPFVHQQLYRDAAEANGNGSLLVQRAIRAPGHCDFSRAEITNAVNDFLGWVNDDVVPPGDDVDRATIRDETYGCAHTVNDNKIIERGPYVFDVPACPAEV